ncbi:hypothetical protein F511_03767 [Dorcoceras hygrometricum]|uniref:Uncharacterized protein n=1 Tax=Dorcoceras hygrometricum TaxID=472368 RepID=A0A2Z7B544_9LAMI|nr:hypothetical protein F511_03767 [Dorcoceras hygrometricum]
MWYPRTEHYSINLIYVIKGESNQKAHAKLGNLYRGLATSSGDALTPALSRGASNLRRHFKLGIPPDASYPTCWRILPRYVFPSLEDLDTIFVSFFREFEYDTTFLVYVTRSPKITEYLARPRS